MLIRNVHLATQRCCCVVAVVGGVVVAVVVGGGGGVCCVFLLGCIWITVFTINNIFDVILVTNIYSKYHF